MSVAAMSSRTKKNRCDIVDLTLKTGTRVRGSYEWDSEDWIELEVWNE